MIDESQLPLNSRDYWEERFENDWESSGGPQRTLLHAEVLRRHLPEWLAEDLREHRLSLCDWGCAEGEAVNYLGQVFAGLPVCGIDIAAGAIVHARQKFPASDFMAQDWLAESPEPRLFDVVFSSHVLQHFADPLAILRDTLGPAAAKHLVLLLPFGEAPAGPDAAGSFRFLKRHLPLAWDDWRCAYFEVLDAEQALIVYTRESWLKEIGIEPTLASFPMETARLENRLRGLERQVAELNQKKSSLETRLESQLAHDQILLKSNNRLQEQNTRIQEDLARAGEQRGALERHAAALEARHESILAEKNREQARADALEAGRSQTRGECDELARRLLQAEEQRERTGERLATLERAEERFSAAAARLAEQKDLLERECAGLRAQVAELTRLAETLEADDAGSKQTIARLNQDVEDLLQQGLDLLDQNSELEKRIGELERQRAVAGGDAARLQERNAEILAQFNQLQNEHQGLRGIHAQVMQQHGQLQRFDEQLQQRAARLEERAAELDRRVAELSADAARLEADRDGLRHSLADEQTAGILLRERAVARENEIERLEREYRDLSAGHAQLTAAHEDLEREKVRLWGIVNELQRRSTEHWERAEQLQEDKAALEADHAELQARGQRMQAAMDSLEKEKLALTEIHAELEKQLDALAKDRERLTAANAQLEALKKEKDQAALAAAQNQARLEGLKREQEELNARLEEQNRSLMAITEQLQQRLKALTDNNANFQVRNRQLQKTINRLEEERVELDRARKELLEIKGMYYYRWACRVDNLRVSLGLRSDPKKPRPDRQIEGPERRVTGLIEDKSVPAPPPRVQPADTFAVPRRPSGTGKPMRQLTVGAIMDKFTMACFEPECNLLAFRPDNWETTLAANPIDFLFVESAWAGNGGSWQYRVGTYAAPPGRELDDVLAWCRKKGVPTVFWNKEDPPHFEKFIAAAAKFDRVFTTDGNCVERYRKHCGHERIDALPFAAQPRIHNPVLTRKRDRQTCFAGTYYADTFEARRHDMEALLRGGAGFGLEIYDRRYGYAGADAKRFAFPDEFQPLIRGRLEYEQMLDAYRWYRAFLNVNSIYDSPTMFSRRVFELLACGTPVVTTPSLGVGLFFGDLVPQVRSAPEVRAALERLLGDSEQWWQTSARGIRLVMGQHTYAHRLQTICDRLGLAIHTPPPPVLAAVVTPQGDAAEFAECLRQQSEPPAAVIVAGEGGPADAHVARLRAAGLNAVACPSGRLETMLREHFGDGCLAFMNSLNAYGPEYLRDARFALSYCGKDVTGMSTYYKLDPAGTLRLEEGAGEEYFMRDRLLGETLVLLTRRLGGALLAKALAGGTVVLEEPGYARSRFEFIASCQEPLPYEQSKKVFLKLPD